MADLRIAKSILKGSQTAPLVRNPISPPNPAPFSTCIKTDSNRYRTGFLIFSGLTLFLSLGLSFSAAAENDRWIPNEYISNQHLRFVEEERAQSLLQEGASGFYAISELSSDLIRRARVSVARWEWVNAQPPLPSEPYSRRVHFGNWIRFPDGQGGCFDTRAYILTRSSKVPVTLNPRNNCTVVRGRWTDPFTGKTVTNPQSLQIDHTVPLREVYYSGAWQWSQQRRCMYFNFIESEFHLVPIDSFENNKKGTKSPKDYMPPNESYACQYLVHWLKIKAIWNVVMWPEEAEGLFALIQQHQCPGWMFRLDQTELNRLRQSIDAGMRGCGAANY